MANRESEGGLECRAQGLRASESRLYGSGWKDSGVGYTAWGALRMPLVFLRDVLGSLGLG